MVNQPDLFAVAATQGHPATAGLVQHPLAIGRPDMPAMDDMAYASLRASIAQHGLRHPIMLYEDAVLDGWHRQQACAQTGAPAHYEVFTGDDDAASAYLRSAHLRKNVEDWQKPIIAAKMAMVMPKRKKLSVTQAIKEAAQMVDARPKSAAAAYKILQSGNAANIAALERGKYRHCLSGMSGAL